MFASMLWWVRRARSMRDIRCAERFSRPDVAVLLRLVQLGLPIALALFFEVTLFAVVALLVSPLGIIDVAGHQIALNFSSLMFVLPLSLAAAVTIRVGFRLGQGSTIDAQVSARTGVGVGVCLAVFTAIFTVLMREQIALLYNDNPEVVLLASHLMLLAAIYQISDSIQVIGSGILRGYKDTRSIFFITFTAYWVLGLPSGYLLALTDMVVPRMGPAGFLVWIYHRPDLRRHHDDAADAFSTAPALQHHLTARRALVPAKPAPPAGFFRSPALRPRCTFRYSPTPKTH
ncbi:multi antimicrobial extrusion protein (Na(+)/drug antiporter) [Klebsiella aerogenes]|nr:multi antimicrobial extrusion protein (Na(+)/drug antiporter) [Klebsiella aerogenes]